MSDMGGLYRIAEALRADPTWLAQQADQLALNTERLELDRRALAIQYAKDTIKFDFRTDKEPNSPPEHERVLETARAYYTFLTDGPNVGQQDSEQPR